MVTNVHSDDIKEKNQEYTVHYESEIFSFRIGLFYGFNSCKKSKEAEKSEYYHETVEDEGVGEGNEF